MLSDRDKLVNELKVMTGVVTEDLDYMIYLLLKGGSYFNSSDKAEMFISTGLPKENISVVDMSTWFSQFK